MDGKALAERIRSEIAEEVRELGEIGLATVLVGDDPASDTYIRLKHKAAAEVGINARDIRLASQTTEEELLEQVEQLNADDAIDGLLVQLPLPDHIDEPRVIRAIAPAKDVDGLHPFNFGHLALGHPTHVGATPVGIMALLEEYDVSLEGARAVVVGRCRCSSCTRTRRSLSVIRGRGISPRSRVRHTSSSSQSGRPVSSARTACERARR